LFTLSRLGLIESQASSPHRPKDQSKHQRRERKKNKDIRFSERELWEIINGLEPMVRHIEPFKELFSEVPPAYRLSFETPEELSKAWLHSIMSVVYCAKDLTLFNDQITKAFNLVSKGIKKVVRSLTQKSLLEKSVFMPFEVASLVNSQLLQDITGPHPDITDSYREYLNSLVRTFVNIR
jgi:hypothetical protein